jgi:hypothetical protein
MIGALFPLSFEVPNTSPRAELSVAAELKIRAENATFNGILIGSVVMTENL